MSGSGGRPGVVVLGGINMDLVTYSARFPEAGETVAGERFLTYAGGKGANQAVAAARMGAPTAMVGRVGDDLFGPQLVDGLRAAGVDVAGVTIAPGETSGIAVIGIDAAAQNRIIQILGANETCAAAESAAVENALQTASVLMLQLEVPAQLSAEVAQAAAAAGKTVILDPGPVRPIPAELYRHCSVITPNETEAEALIGFPVANPDDGLKAARVLLDRGIPIAVVKLGAQGAVYAGRDGSAGWQPPFAVDAVDTVAAGDAFNGALAVGLAEGLPLPDAVRQAAAAGALAVTAVGAQDAMPHRAAVAALIRNAG